MLSLKSYRRFGVEMEINSLDRKSRPDNIRDLPVGIYEIGNILVEAVGDYVEVRKWGHTHWEKKAGYWVIKPDHSCGLEVCSPVMKGWHGIKEVCVVSDALRNDPRVRADYRCGLHIHVNVADLTQEQIASVLRAWIKCEMVFVDSIPRQRKNNRYCQIIGLWDWLQHDQQINSKDLIDLLGETKYTTINTFHLKKGKRSTIEFRIAENGASLNSYSLKNWIRLVIHFVEIAKNKFDMSNSFSWYDPQEVLRLLQFDSKKVSPAFEQLRNWFMMRLMWNIRSDFSGALSVSGRSVAASQILKEIKSYSSFDFSSASYPKIPNAVYSDKYRY